jgi:hypothetical protein
MKSFLVLILSFGFIFVSCADLKKNDQIKRVTALEKRLKKIELTRKSNEIDSLTENGCV